MPLEQSKANRWQFCFIPLGIVLFCLGVIWLSTHFEKMPPILKRGIQPADFPQLVAGLMILLTALMVWREPIHSTEKMGRMTWSTLGLMGVFVVFAVLDFFLALAIFAVGLAMLWGERRWLFLGIVGFGIPLAVFFLFDLVFEIRFPRGILTRLWYD